MQSSNKIIIKKQNDIHYCVIAKYFSKKSINNRLLIEEFKHKKKSEWPIKNS